MRSNLQTGLVFLVLLIWIALWKAPFQSSSRFKVGPVDLKEFLALSRYLDESFFDLLPRANLLILSLANLS
jgi:hypothetical protein